MLVPALAPMKVCPSCRSEFGGGEVFCPVDGTRLTTRSQMDLVRRSEADDPLIGVTLAGRYEVTRRIGEGGMGIVYEARHVIIEKRVALKVLREDVSGRSDVVERFRQEARSASLIGHENIVDISDFGVTPSGQNFFVMEMLDGEDLANVLARDCTVSVSRAVDIVLQCCRALGAAHSKGIVHRDMKPENIFLTRRDGADDFVKIVDFGIAKMSDIDIAGDPSRKLTKTGMIFGTPEYMSPEQASGKKLDHRVDVYAMGIILYELLTGRVPFVGDTFMGILTQHLFENPPPMRSINQGCQADKALETIVAKALSKDPDARYQTMNELAEALADLELGSEEMTGVGLRARRSATKARRLANTMGAEGSTQVAYDAIGGLGRGSSQKKRRMLVLLGAGVLVAVFGISLSFFVDSTLEEKTQPGRASTAQVSRGQKSPTATGEESHEGTKPESNADSDAETDALGDANAALDSGDQGAASTALEQVALVDVRVTTQPEGALIIAGELGEVCNSAPCSFQAPAGEAIVIEAKLGRAQAKRSIVPADGGSDVLLELKVPSQRRRVAARGASRSSAKTSEPEEAEARSNESSDRSRRSGGRRRGSDLKVPEIFR